MTKHPTNWNLQSLHSKLDKLQAYRNRSKRRITLNKVQVDLKIADTQKTLTELQAKIDDTTNAEHDAEDRFVTALEQRQEEIMDDLDSRKRTFMSDLDVYEDDVTYEVDRVMDCTEEMALEVDEGRDKVQRMVERKSCPCPCRYRF